MKKFLLNLKPLVILFWIAGLFLFCTSADAATKTWNGGAGTNKNWTTGANWVGGVAPVAGDDVVFNTAGTITFSTMPASVAYNSITISQGTVTIVGGAPAKTYTFGGNAGTDFTVALGATFSMGTNTSITLATNATATIAGTFIVGASSVYNTNGTGVVTTVTGTITDNNTVTCTTAAKLLFQSGSIYDIDQLGGVVPTATWDPNSNCNITLTSPASGTGSWATGTTQTFGNMTITTTGAGTNGWVIGNSINCAGNFTLANGSSRPALLTNSATGFSITAGGDYTQSGTLDLSSASTGNGVINVGGDFSNTGTITENGTSTASGIVFNGTGAQAFAPGTISNNLRVTVNNAAGVTLSGALTINNLLTLTAGIFSVNPGVTLTISNGSAIAGTPSATNRIATLVNTGTGAQGFLRVNNIASNSSYVFPVGNATNFLPDTLVLSAATTTANNSFSVCAFQGITTNGTPNGTAFTLAQKTKVVDAVWTINYNGPGNPTQSPGSTTIKLGWPASLEGSAFALNGPGLIGIAHYGPAAWGTSQQTSASNTFNYVTLALVTSFSPFAVGTIDPGGAPLAIQVGYFNASKGNVVNTLNWSAACNSAQATFEIERSADGRNFTAINSITASQARCALPFTYDDASPLAGVNFYRIKIIDVDGRVSYTSTVKVGAQQKDMVLVGVLPNPVSNIAQLNVTTAKKDRVELAVVSLEGKVVYTNAVQLQSGSSIVTIDATNFAKGAYLIRGVFSNGEVSTVKFIKQ